jgi:deoxycytidylate deaminase
MTHSPFEQMQGAVDIVNSSPHPANKIAATVFGHDGEGYDFSVSRTNYWPPAIEHHFGHEARIGASSGTIHAETACLLATPFTGGASLCVTDPFCPNCAKNITEAGIRTIYIDHKGFQKDFAARRREHFEWMSLKICERAGIPIYTMFRKEQRVEPLLSISEDYIPAEDSPVEIESIGAPSRSVFEALVAVKRRHHRGRKIAIVIARDAAGHAFGLTARTHPAIGYSMARDAALIEKMQGKYSFILEPLNRLLMNAPRRGLKILDGLIYSSGVPTAREQVNMAGAGLHEIYIEDFSKARDETAFEAMTMLRNAGIIAYRQIF